VYGIAQNLSYEDGRLMLNTLKDSAAEVHAIHSELTLAGQETPVANESHVGSNSPGKIPI